MLSHFLLGASVCFVSTLPFGPINLTVARTTVQKNHWRGLEVALAAALVETLQVLIAVWFGLFISGFLENSVGFRIVVATVFVVLGLVIYFRQPSANLNSDTHTIGSEIKTGLAVAAINPQAFPFWIVALAAITDYTDLALEGPGLALFLGGVFFGKVLALTGFIAVSHYLKTHLEQSGRLVNHALGAVLVVVGLVQWIRLLRGT